MSYYDDKLCFVLQGSENCKFFCYCCFTMMINCVCFVFTRIRKLHLVLTVMINFMLSYQDGKQDAEYPFSGVLSMAVLSSDSINPPNMALGSEKSLVFFSTCNGEEVKSIETECRVMCLLATDNSLFAGLDSGFILVISISVSVLYVQGIFMRNIFRADGQIIVFLLL